MAATVLVLDAEPLVRSVMAKILQREGYTVHVSGSLQEATDLLKNCSPDLLLTNIYIPGTTGHDAAKALRALCPEMEVLMVAGLPEDEAIRERTSHDEKYESFPKPFKAQELAEKVREMLSRAGG